MTRLTFRSRVLLYLVLFAVVPASVLMLGGVVTIRSTLPVLSGSSAWDQVAVTGRRAIAAVRQARLTPAERGAVDAHEHALAASLLQARRYRYLTTRAVALAAVAALLGCVLLALLASRVAGHLSRQLSRPLHELVAWTELIAEGKALPAGPPRRGAPEFEVLRTRMRTMAGALATAREREREAERLEAFRETARQVAHELKNPLTPIRLAVARLRREADPSLAELVDVLDTESRRLEMMARDFAQFGRLPEGPAAAVDLAELARYTARATVPEQVPLRLEVEGDVPLVRGHYDALARALSNVLINAVEACRRGGDISVRVGRCRADQGEWVAVHVCDSGCGIPAEQLPRIWDPYVTHKGGGTGLGLAITRQTILAHGGRIAATSVVGTGTEISLVIPADGAESTSGSPLTRSPLSSSSLTIGG